MAGARGERQGKISLRAIQPGVLEGVYEGYISGRLADEMFPAFQAALAGGTTTHWLLNGVEIDGFDSRSLVAAKPWFDAFKAQGGQMVIVMSASSPVRMATAALGFGMSLTLKVVTTRAEVSALLPPR